MINLSYGGSFDEKALVRHISQSGRNYIIQGQQNHIQAAHTKPDSLDYWLRQFAHNPHTKQADDNVIAALVATGLFKVSYNLPCPKTGQLCKGLILV